MRTGGTFMSRETALKELQDIRKEIIEIHQAYDECQYYGKKFKTCKMKKKIPRSRSLLLNR